MIGQEWGGGVKLLCHELEVDTSNFNFFLIRFVVPLGYTYQQSLITKRIRLDRRTATISLGTGFRHVSFNPSCVNKIRRCGNYFFVPILAYCVSIEFFLHRSKFDLEDVEHKLSRLPTQGRKESPSTRRADLLMFSFAKSTVTTQRNRVPSYVSNWIRIITYAKKEELNQSKFYFLNSSIVMIMIR